MRELLFKKVSGTIVFLSIAMVLLIGFFVTNFYYSFATSGTSGTPETYTFALTDNSSVNLEPLSSKKVFYQVHNTTDGTVKYGIGYNTLEEVTVMVCDDSPDYATSIIGKDEYRNVKLLITNNSNDSVTVTLSTVLGYVGGGDLITPNGTTLVVSE